MGWYIIIKFRLKFHKIRPDFQLQIYKRAMLKYLMIISEILLVQYKTYTVIITT